MTIQQDALVQYRPPQGEILAVTHLPVAALVVSDRHARMHPPHQIELIKKSIKRVGFTAPIVIGSGHKVLAGAARLTAALEAGMTKVPTVSLAHLPEADQRAYMLADNKLAELATWDEDVLKLELADLAGLELDLELTDLGFSSVELDTFVYAPAAEAAEDQALPVLQKTAVSRLGDVWQLGRHRLVCGDARDPAAYATLMPGEKARMVFADVPFNIPIRVMSPKTAAQRREFPIASGEMTPAQFTAFLGESLVLAAKASLDGAIHYVPIDWRSVADVIQVGKTVIGEMKNLIVWAKPNAGMGSFYRSQHELIAVFKYGNAPHTNNFGLGGDGRYRTNVWNYPGGSGFHADRDEDLSYHPTAKPVIMIAEAILDVTAAGEIVLDPFGGSGSTLMAAEQTGRCARLIELDPLYADVICRRFMDAGGQVVLHGGGAFAAVEAERGEASARSAAAGYADGATDGDEEAA